MERGGAKLRLFVMAVCAIAVVAAVAGGCLYYATLKDKATRMAHAAVEDDLDRLAEQLERDIDWNRRAARALAGLSEVRHYAAGETGAALSAVNARLDAFQEAFRADVCYLLDRSGVTRASSNRRAADSFVGRNFAFRPYFQEAMAGRPAVYAALGKVSKKRGLYFSHPVYAAGGEGPVGVAVIKTSVGPLDRQLEAYREGAVLLLDPLGVVFAANRPDWRLALLWDLPFERRAAVDPRQFGDRPLAWTGISRRGGQHAVDQQGRVYRVHRRPVAGITGWELLYLHDEGLVTANHISPINRSVGTTLLVLLPFMLVSIALLYHKIRFEIVRRERAEARNRQLIAELRETLAQVKQLSGLLPICTGCKKIRDDQGYWNRLESYIETRSEAQFSHGICPECTRKLYPELDIDLPAPPSQDPGLPPAGR